MGAKRAVGLWSLLNLMTFLSPAVSAAMAATTRHHDHIVLRLFVALCFGSAVGFFGGRSQLRLAARWNQRALPALYAATVLILSGSTVAAVGVTVHVLRRAGFSTL